MPSEFNALDWLAHWYAQRCNDEWEHGYGIKLDTLDNPGWTLTINLADTALSGKPFDRQDANLESEDGDPNIRWHSCWVEDNNFRAACGVYDLSNVISIFRQFAEA